MASSQTKRNYLTKGMVYAAQGQRAHPDTTPLDALCRHAEHRCDILKPSTVRLYRRQYATAAVKLCRDAGLDQSTLASALERILAALRAIEGDPPVPRTASKKTKDPRDWMVKEVFGHLKIMAVCHRRIRSAACALYCLLVPKLGTRPVELTQAWLEGDILVVPNAKQPDGQKTIRRIDISDFHSTHREALLALIYIVDRDVEAGGYDAWLKRLAETLARACATVNKKTTLDIPRLSPSSFRHTTISTWHAAGFTAEEIAELVGHRDVRSQKAYKRTNSAWPLTQDLAKPVEREQHLALDELSAPDTALSAQSNSSLDRQIDRPGPPLDLDDMPQPEAKSAIGSKLWSTARKQLESQLDQFNHSTNEKSGGGTTPPTSNTRPRR